jgi:hypothetical protein
MKYLLLARLLGSTALLRAPEDGSGSGSFFNPDGGGDGQQQQQQQQSQSQGGNDDKGGQQQQQQQQSQRPEWLLEKFKTPEDQAKAYSEMYGQFSKKTEDLRKEVLADAIKEYGKTVGVPEKPDAYAYPEGFQAPGEAVDKALRDWAHKNNVGADAFQALVKDVHGLTVANADAELKKLGDNAQDRIKEVNGWVTQNIPKEHFGVVSKIMTTAEGVAFMEAIAADFADSGFAPDGGQQQSKVLTRDEIRKMQEDPRWMTDDAYTKEVRAHWQAYAALPADKRK